MRLMHAQSIGVFYVNLRKIDGTLFLQYANNNYFTLVIISPLHNHKQDVGNIGVWDQFLSI